MTECPQCGKPISSVTEPCPHCGNQPKSQEATRETAPKKAAPVEKTSASKAVPPENGDAKTKKKKPKKIRWVGKAIILGLVLFIAVILIKRSCDKEPLPPAPPNDYVSSDYVEYFKAVRKAVGYINTGKKYFRVANAEMKGLPPPESAPESQAVNSDTSVAAKTAENFALALEHFKLAEKSFREARASDPLGELGDCRKTYLSAMDQYIDSASTLNEYSKARMNNDVKKMKSNSQTDADANYQMGEKLMAEALVQGCKGKLFLYTKSLDADDRGLIFLDYKEFFAEKFPEHQAHIESLLDYKAPADTLPSETQPAETQPAPSL